MEEQITVRFVMHKKNQEEDITIPLDISAMELIMGLNSAYSLGIDTQELAECYLSCENPITLLRGNKTLREFNLRNGSIIHFTR